MFRLSENRKLPATELAVFVSFRAHPGLETYTENQL